MATRIYGTVDPETGQAIKTRAIESFITKPKIDSELEAHNIGFWEKHFDWIVGPGEIYNFWSKGQGTKYIPEKTAQAWSSGFKTVVGTGMGTLLTVAVLIAAIVIIPRILPIK